ncbi:hypothetical protein Ddye_012885 [Dipteronia dyeriana]|uniref:Uncharacterized protein n=1 Tax=Dipteronia dyeriana TaxID=168575 RepID=A0AAD9X565_9ROSI|nr:hypothetical protein Ddye_012885 [Dipteronia dyeriana]
MVHCTTHGLDTRMTSPIAKEDLDHGTQSSAMPTFHDKLSLSSLDGFAESNHFAAAALRCREGDFNLKFCFCVKISEKEIKKLVFDLVQRVVRVLELAGGVMDELANPTGPRKEVISNHCREFMQKIKARLIF